MVIFCVLITQNQFLGASDRDAIITAEEAILAGDEAYQASDFKEAASQYREAFKKLSGKESAHQFREAARERYAQAAVQAARALNRGGDRGAALKMIEEVLSEKVHPKYLPAQQLRDKLEDPIRSNPSLTSEHAQNIDEVRRLLYKAEGAYNLAKFDEAITKYEAVLRIDPYNKAARRGMERSSVAISDYANAARDQTRATMLSQTDAEWEFKDKQAGTSANSFSAQALANKGPENTIDTKLDSLIVPFIDFEDVTLEEAVEYLEGQSRALDSQDGGEGKGIDFVMDMGAERSPHIEGLLRKTFSFRLRNVPLREVVEYIVRFSETSYRVDPYAVVIQPTKGLSEVLTVSRYQVPPTFLTQTSSAAGGEEDPFGGGDDTATLSRRLTAKEYLEQQGITFPEGASASYTPALGQLVVRNTRSAHELIQSIIESINLEEPIAIVIESKILRISQENLEELGFDHTIENLARVGAFSLGGGTTGNGRGDAAGTGNPLTSGLRSGDFATGGNPLQDALNLDRLQRPVVETQTVRELDFTVNPVTLETISSEVTVNGGIQEPSPLSSAPGVLSLQGTFNAFGFTTLLRALDQKKGVDAMAQSSVVTRSGEQALIDSTREFIYPTEYESPELPESTGGDLLGDLEELVNEGIALDEDEADDLFESIIDLILVSSGVAGEERLDERLSNVATPAHPTAFETRRLGVSLEVQPTVSADRKYVSLSIAPRIDEFLGFINYGEAITGSVTDLNRALVNALPGQSSFLGISSITETANSVSEEVTPNNILMPLFNSIRLNTTVDVANGHTIMLGGIVSETIEDVEDKVPILGSLPLIGKSFRTSALRREKEVVMIFVTVRIVDPGGNPVE